MWLPVGASGSLHTAGWARQQHVSGQVGRRGPSGEDVLQPGGRRVSGHIRGRLREGSRLGKRPTEPRAGPVWLAEQSRRPCAGWCPHPVSPQSVAWTLSVLTAILGNRCEQPTLRLCLRLERRGHRGHLPKVTAQERRAGALSFGSRRHCLAISQANGARAGFLQLPQKEKPESEQTEG